MNSGIIIDIPFVKTKCPIAVNTSIIDIAILADKVKSYFFVINLIAKREIINVTKRIIKGFIFFYILKYKG
ncbi:hypothetical protein GCM10023311_03030 [Flaviramulus aquimarinus]|uniref:Uncharacterized protein n=1 Tax=Flaviramulus aquimarinus TaxID=1170456 RepID=A0ABP9EPU2_9FLAO